VGRLIGREEALAPDAPVPLEKQYLSYKQLDEVSSRLAFYLKERGVGPGTIAGVLVKRSLEMMIGLIAILKAGGTYLPLDPEHPEARLKYILEKSGTSYLLTQGNLMNRLEGLNFGGERMDVFAEGYTGEGSWPLGGEQGIGVMRWFRPM